MWILKAEKDEEEANGYFKIHDINPDDLDFEVQPHLISSKNVYFHHPYL